ncbi:hypothetical protein P4282_00935 [Bacillus swezeyi]|uniref:hypothetical protein n=1 Tax=Bacillus swezeyi TaxID=1925020 RepID=UPI002E1F3D4C|nr:hypothetical protein [Bacillus swezeyi]
MVTYNGPVEEPIENPSDEFIISIIFEKLNYWGDKGGSETMARTDLKRFRIRGINKDSDPITAVNTISGEVYRRRDEIRQFRGIQDLD